MHALLKKLAGGDRRSIGKSNQVVVEASAEVGLFGVLFEGMLDADPVLRMRCADAVEKITARHSEYLQPFKRRLMREVAKIDQKEVRWHVAQMLSRLALNARERRMAMAILSEYLEDESKIVKTFSMQALAEIAEQDADLRAPIIAQLQKLTRTGSPAMKARGKKLLAKLTPKSI